MRRKAARRGALAAGAVAATVAAAIAGLDQRAVGRGRVPAGAVVDLAGLLEEPDPLAAGAGTT